MNTPSIKTAYTWLLYYAPGGFWCLWDDGAWWQADTWVPRLYFLPTCKLEGGTRMVCARVRVGDA